MSRHEVRIHLERSFKLVDALLDSPGAGKVEPNSCINNQRLRVKFLCPLYLCEALITAPHKCEKVCIPMVCSGVIRIQLKASFELFFTFAKVIFDVPLEHCHSRVSFGERIVKLQRHRRRRSLLLLLDLERHPKPGGKPVSVCQPGVSRGIVGVQIDGCLKTLQGLLHILSVSLVPEVTAL